MGTWGGVAYHLDGQAGRSTFWGNGTQIKIKDWSIWFRIAFTISTNQFHLPKNDRQGLKTKNDAHSLLLKLVSKMALKKWTNFRLQCSVGKNRTIFSDVP